MSIVHKSQLANEGGPRVNCDICEHLGFVNNVAVLVGGYYEGVGLAHYVEMLIFREVDEEAAGRRARRKGVTRRHRRRPFVRNVASEVNHVICVTAIA